MDGVENLLAILKKYLFIDRVFSKTKGLMCPEIKSTPDQYVFIAAFHAMPTHIHTCNNNP